MAVGVAVAVGIAVAVGVTVTVGVASFFCVSVGFGRGVTVGAGLAVGVGVSAGSSFWPADAATRGSVAGFRTAIGGPIGGNRITYQAHPHQMTTTRPQRTTLTVGEKVREAAGVALPAAEADVSSAARSA